MPQFERRLYEPSDDARAFDSDEDIEDEGSRLPLLIGIALVVLLSFAGVVWLAYTQGVERGRSDAPRIVAANDSVASGRKPPAYSKLNIYQSPKTDEDVASEDTATPSAKTTPPDVTSSKTTTPVAKPELKSTLPNPAPAVARPTRPSISGTRATTPQPATAAPRVITPPLAVKPASPTPNTAKKPATIPAASLVTPKKTQAAAKQSKAGEPAVKTASAAPAETRPAKAVISQLPKTTAKVAPIDSATAPSAAAPLAQTSTAKTTPPAEAKGTTAAVAGGFMLQIGSYKSDAEANASWQTYKGAHSSVAGYSTDVRKVELGAKGTWYRLRIGPFASLSEANAACVKLKAQGGNCFPAKQ